VSPAQIIMELLNTMGEAICDGEWEVLDENQPFEVMERAEEYLRSIGYVQNAIDGSWMGASK